MNTTTPLTAPPTYETLRELWLKAAPTCGATERYDREVNFEEWARAHGIRPAVDESTALSWHVENNITGARVSRDYPSVSSASGACRALNEDAGAGGRFGVYDQNGDRA